MAAQDSSIKTHAASSKVAFKALIHLRLNIFSEPLYQILFLLFFPLFKNSVVVGQRKERNSGFCWVCAYTTGFLSDCQIYLLL